MLLKLLGASDFKAIITTVVNACGVRGGRVKGNGESTDLLSPLTSVLHQCYFCFLL